MRTLIQLQDSTLARMAEPRTSKLRAERNRSRAIKRYGLAVLKLGYTQEQVEAQKRDLWDMWKLYMVCEQEGE